MEPYATERPQRASAKRALEKMQAIRTWETCSESSAMFIEASNAMNALFEQEAGRRSKRVATRADFDKAGGEDEEPQGPEASEDDSEAEVSEEDDEESEEEEMSVEEEEEDAEWEEGEATTDEDVVEESSAGESESEETVPWEEPAPKSPVESDCYTQPMPDDVGDLVDAALVDSDPVLGATAG